MKVTNFESVASLTAFVGRPAMTAQPIVIEQSIIDSYAEIVQDRQWVHVDRTRAANESPFGTTIAHGLLTLSLITGWFNQLFAFPGRKLALNYGFDKVRFPAPVPSGSSLAGSFILSRVDELSEKEARCHWRVEARVAGAERPAMVAEWLTQIRY